MPPHPPPHPPTPERNTPAAMESSVAVCREDLLHDVWQWESLRVRVLQFVTIFQASRQNQLRRLRLLPPPVHRPVTNIPWKKTHSKKQPSGQPGWCTWCQPRNTALLRLRSSPTPGHSCDQWLQLDDSSTSNDGCNNHEKGHLMHTTRTGI